MALVLADRVRETTDTSGIGPVTLDGAVTAYQTFAAAIGDGNQTYYTIASPLLDEWEVGIGTYFSTGNLLTRNTVLSSSNAGSLVSFTLGAKDVFVTQPSERTVFVDQYNVMRGANNANANLAVGVYSAQAEGLCIIPPQANGMSLGPLNIGPGSSVTVTAGQYWLIVTP
jgi:hypothetical protein